MDIPSSGKWDYAVFKQLGRVEDVPPDDENKQLLVGLLDNAILDKGCLQKSMKETSEDGKAKGFKPTVDMDNFASCFDGGGAGAVALPGRVLPVYAPGDVVKGHLSLVLKKELAAEKLCFEFLGQAACKIRLYSQHGAYYDDTKKEDFVKEDRVFWKKDGVSDVSDKYCMLQLSGTPAKSPVLRAGFAFQFVIPQDAAQSMPALVHSTVNYVRLVYRLKATIKMGTFSRDIVTHKGIWVAKTYDISSDEASLQPATVTDTLDTGTLPFWKSGSVTVSAKVPRSAFLKSESVPITVEVNNQTSGEITKAKARLMLVGKTRTGKMHFSKTIRLKSRKILEGPIAAGMNPVFKWELPWDFSHSSVDSGLLPVGKLDDSKLIDIQYKVAIKIKRKGFRRNNMELHMPITVGTEDSSGTAKQPGVASLFPSVT